jgi:small GTP-binding protein
MGLQDTPRANRLHIGFYGRRNAGKSSLINIVTGQETALVSAHAGTTTDPVIKSMELLPLGPIAVIDTAGFDDTGDLGGLRISRTREMIDRTDLALLVIAADNAADVSTEKRMACRTQDAQ